MSATACTLATLLLFEAAAFRPATEECPLTDNRCKASLYERRAADAPNPAQRAQYLYTAYRSYLFLFEKTGDQHDLCAARRALDASIAVTGQPPAQRMKSTSMRDALAERAQAEGARCKSVARRRIKKADAPLIARHAAPVDPEPGLAPPDPPKDRASADIPTTPADTGLMPVPRTRERTKHPATTPRPGRGLMIAGGVSLGVGVVLTATAGFMGRRMLDTRRELVALGNSVDGYATADQDVRDDALRRDFQAMKPATLALAFGAGATVLVAVLLTSIGGRRMARAASRTALIPAPGGLVFHTRF